LLGQTSLFKAVPARKSLLHLVKKFVKTKLCTRIWISLNVTPSLHREITLSFLFHFPGYAQNTDPRASFDKR
jgi:hypothetical protein